MSTDFFSSVRVTGMACLLASLVPVVHAAEAYPQRAVRVIIPFPPAGAGDILGRMLTVRLTETMGQQFINDNRPGGGQVIATELAARANPDGHTLFLASATHAINPSLWYQMLAPAQMPAPILKRLHTEITRVLKLPDFIEQLAAQGGEPLGSTPQEARRFTEVEIERWANLIRKANISAQ